MSKISYFNSFKLPNLIKKRKTLLKSNRYPKNLMFSHLSLSLSLSHSLLPLPINGRSSHDLTCLTWTALFQTQGGLM